MTAAVTGTALVECCTRYCQCVATAVCPLLIVSFTTEKQLQQVATSLLVANAGSELE
jgi:predicted molibdopterin-dependent oxidoreductase YjgC